MLELTTSAILDGLIHLGAFFLKSVGLYLLLSLIARHKFETNFFRSIIVISALVLVRIYTSNNSWGENIVVVAAISFIVSYALHLLILKTSMVVGCVSAILICSLSLGLDQAATRVSAKLLPEGPTFAQYMGIAQEAVEKNKTNEALKPTEVDLVEVMRKGLDALATLTEEDEVEAIKADFNEGMALFAERKAWMDSLTPEEKRAYKEEMAAFLAEQGLASDRYSLAAIKEVNPTNLVVLADLFSELQDEEVEEDIRIRSIPESLGVIAANFSGVTLGERELGMLQNFAELFAKDEIEEAIAQARKELEDSQGENLLAGAVLTALIQAESGLPADQLLYGNEGISSLDTDHLKGLASRHWKRRGLNPDLQWNSASGIEPGTVGVAEIQLSEEESAPDMIHKPEPFVHITTPLGVASVPSDPALIDEWISASHSLQMRGFVSLGNEVVILRNDGEMLRNGDVWHVEHKGYSYRFGIDKIMKDKVSLQGKSREAVSAVN
jgi:hypothetical protein